MFKKTQESFSSNSTSNTNSSSTSNTNSSSTFDKNSKEETISVNDALNEYFNLKTEFENENNIIKQKIMNHPVNSNKEKRIEYLKLKPKCINCREPSRIGTIFSNSFSEADYIFDSHRTLKASCGNLENPCNLNIIINLGRYEKIDDLMSNIRNEIINYKNDIINDKNKILFGLIKTETAIANFELNKEMIKEYTIIYEEYLNQRNNVVDNSQKKIELDESITQHYIYINQIKECIINMNKTNNTKYALDAAVIYNNTLLPLLKKIQQLKYKLTDVYYNEYDKTCNLIQLKNKISDLLFCGYTDNVAAYDVGYLKIKNKKDNLKNKKDNLKNKYIEKDNDYEDSEDSENKITINIKISDIPIIKDDVISWNNPEYQKIWKKIPEKLKTEFKFNIEWMKEFMNSCVNNRLQKPYAGFCKLTTPPNIVLPPRIMENGQYDYGVSIYNKIFNTLPKTLQQTYLTLYKEDETTKVKNYSQLEGVLNDLVKKDVGFGNGAF